MTPAEQAADKYWLWATHYLPSVTEDQLASARERLAAIIAPAIEQARREEREAIKETLCESCKQAV